MRQENLRNPYQSQRHIYMKQCSYRYKRKIGAYQPGFQCINQTMNGQFCRLHRQRNISSVNTFTSISSITEYQNVARQSDILGQVNYENNGERISCKNCGSMMWLKEKSSGSTAEDAQFTMCCNQGLLKQVPLYPPLPNYIETILNSSDNDSVFFKKHIRAFNSLLSFASVISYQNPNVSLHQNNVFTFCVNANIRHVISDITENPREAQFAGIYFFEASEQLNIRFNLMGNIATQGRTILTYLQSIILQTNPYARLFSQLGQLYRNLNNMNQYYLLLMDHSNQIQGRSNDQVGAIVQGTSVNMDRHLIVSLKNEEEKTYKCISLSSRLYDPLSYVLLFPSGTPGWSPKMTVELNDIRKNVSVGQFYRYQLMYRHSRKAFFQSGTLLYQFIVDMFIKMQRLRLFYISQNQGTIIPNMGFTGEEIGAGATILPSSFLGSPRYYRESYLDAIQIVSNYGRPDIFLTMTSNPNWEELNDIKIRDNRCANSMIIDSVRLFHLKLKSLLNSLTKKSILGHITAYTYTIEFQKRGLPHCHLLLWLHDDDKPRSGESIDSITCAHFPNDEHSTLYHLVKSHMVHASCSPSRLCWDHSKGACRFNFPKQYSELTYKTENEIIYRRPANNPLNRMVANYNPYLLLKYACHIHVDICHSNFPIKYLFKYVYKGVDTAVAQINIKDEISQFIAGRYVSAPESAWRVLNFDIQENQPSVYRLDVHLPADSRTFGYTLSNGNKRRQSKLLKWFDLNSHFKFLKQVHDIENPIENTLYIDIPRKCVWKDEENCWEIRKQGNTIGRLYNVDVKNKELFYLRLLLMHVADCTGYHDLLTYQNTRYNSFEESAQARGLCVSDDHVKRTLTDAVNSILDYQLRLFFAVLIVYYGPQEPRRLWDHFEEYFILDFLRQGLIRVNAIQNALSDINEHLLSMGSSLSDLQTFDDLFTQQITHENNLISTQQNQYFKLINSSNAFHSVHLSDDQQAVFDTIIKEIETTNFIKKSFFLQAEAGTGKTFLLNHLINYLNFNKKIVVSTGSTGISAILLEHGMTTHSTFKLSLNTQDAETHTPNLSYKMIEFILTSSLIIVDEATCLNRFVIEQLDRLLKKIMSRHLNKPELLKSSFGGKLILFCGDFNQTMPVIPQGSMAEVCDACFFNSSLWSSLTKLHLFTKMRFEATDQHHDEYLTLLKTIKSTNSVNLTSVGHFISIPNMYFCPDNNIQSLIDFVFPDLENHSENEKSAILCTTNEDCKHVNNLIINQLAGQTIICRSIDQIDEDVPNARLATLEEIHHLTPPGIPPHVLNLKTGMKVMLIRNLSIQKGLVNGQILQILHLTPRFLKVALIGGKYHSTVHGIPPIIFVSDKMINGIKFRRIQLPVIPAYAITIHKSQGQTLDRVGVYLKQPVFSHGQLYVAFSRVRSAKKIRILCEESVLRKDERFSSVYNVVNPFVTHFIQ